MAGLLAAGAIMAANCGAPETSPSGQPTPTPTPTPTPSPPNTPPQIKSLTASSLRVEAGHQITFTAVVEDAETPVNQLLYSWAFTLGHGTSSGAMIETGDGHTLTWTAPVGQPTPDDRTFTLTVTENYTSNGVAKQNKVTSAPITIHYNDSVAEITAVGVRFLTVLFPTFSVQPIDAVQDFSDTCPGKADEYGDVVGNRANFHILSGTFSVTSITITADRLFAPDMHGPCVFEDIPMNPANPFYLQKERVQGICTLSAIYENWKWYLCDSHFTSTGNATLESLRFRVPGQIVSSRPLRLPH